MAPPGEDLTEPVECNNKKKVRDFRMGFWLGFPPFPDVIERDHPGFYGPDRRHGENLSVGPEIAFFIWDFFLIPAGLFSHIRVRIGDHPEGLKI